MAFTRRVFAGLATIVTVVLGLSLAVAGSAAADTGVWRAYGNTNPITSSDSRWWCESTVTVASNVGAQICAIRSASGSSVQGAVIVRNNRSSLFKTDASMALFSRSGPLGRNYMCYRSGVAANSWSVCYGKTLARRGGTMVQGHAHDEWLGNTPYR